MENSGPGQFLRTGGNRAGWGRHWAAGTTDQGTLTALPSRAVGGRRYCTFLPWGGAALQGLSMQKSLRVTAKVLAESQSLDFWEEKSPVVGASGTVSGLVTVSGRCLGRGSVPVESCVDLLTL